MRALLLVKQSKRSLVNFKKELSIGNFIVKRMLWKNMQVFSSILLETDVVLIYCNSRESAVEEAVRQLIAGIRQRQYLISIVLMDEMYNKELIKSYSLLGVDGYFSAPFIFPSLNMELKNIICKKRSITVQKWLRAFDLRLDLEHRAVKRQNIVISLRNKEFSLLEFFIINRGKLLTRNVILEHVWDRNADFSSNTVDVHINRLRRKIDNPFKSKLIHTVHSIGYIFDKSPA